ncbi:hypothetical protein E3U43_011569 [Larimichthys crocea]|uniref:Uncharacterized protein n=1 Tax=Larimichthys crocea TaxID=215358 RepID=A0ACD3QJM6_LARCR|nr:hypothetical protein E3U43_011569 [Larimichthys crocea]
MMWICPIKTSLHCGNAVQTIVEIPRTQASQNHDLLVIHINGVMTTDLPVEDNRSSFTLSQPAERLVVTPPSWGQNTVVLKHVLHKPSRKSRVVRSISIGHFSNGLFSLSKFRSEDSRSASLDNRVRNGDSDRGKTSNGGTVWPEKHLQDPQNHLSSPFNLSSQKDQIAFGTNSLSPETATS